MYKQSFLNLLRQNGRACQRSISHFFFWRFYGPQLRLGQLKRKKELNKANIPTTLAEKLQARSINDLLHGRHKDNFFLLDQRGKSPAGQMFLQLDRFP